MDQLREFVKTGKTKETAEKAHTLNDKGALKWAA